MFFNFYSCVFLELALKKCESSINDTVLTIPNLFLFLCNMLARVNLH